MIVLNGEPFVLYNLRALYPFAHQIIVVEGACLAAKGVATPKGHSSDTTLGTLRDFKSHEDPEDKLAIITAEDEGHPDGFWPGEKHEQSQAYAKRATGDYLWQVDVDEFYKPEDMEAVLAMLRDDSDITAVSFKMLTFWGGFDYVADSWYLRAGAETYHRLFRWQPGYRYTTHRPPTVVDSEGRDLRTLKWFDGCEILKRGIQMYHYSLVFPKQVMEKCTYYNEAAWACRDAARRWAEDVYLGLSNPFRVHNVYDYPSWLERYAGTHPPQIDALRRDLDARRVSVVVRPTDDVERVVASPYYTQRRDLLIRLNTRMRGHNGGFNILSVSTADIGGGAEKVARDLHDRYLKAGIASWLAVGWKKIAFSGVIEIPRLRRDVPLESFLWQNEAVLRRWDARIPGLWRLCLLLRGLASGGKESDRDLGREDFRFPGSRLLLQLTPVKPTLLHMHNLHGGYFDLRALLTLTRRVPTVVTLHDEWMFTGHCACTLGCSRWQEGCGDCPDLTIYPPLQADGTSYNLRRKMHIYQRSRLHVAVPSLWLHDRVCRSILQPTECRVIPNGVDISVFHPGNRREARRKVGLPEDALVLLFSATTPRTNRFKDFLTLEKALARLRCPPMESCPVILVCLGSDGDPERFGSVDVVYRPFEPDPAIVAEYNRASDVYVHPSRSDNFPTAILEALVSGVPVVATAVGGIPEQVKGLRIAGTAWVGNGGYLNRFEPRDATGVLVPSGDADALAGAVALLLEDPALRELISGNALADARPRFDLDRMMDDYLVWYEEILSKRDG